MILRELIDEVPGARPFGWWLFDHRQERPIVSRGWFTAKQIKALRAETFGFLHTSMWRGGKKPLQEPEDDYLRRLGLLSDAEEAALREEREWPPRRSWLASAET